MTTTSNHIENIPAKKSCLSVTWFHPGSLWQDNKRIIQKLSGKNWRKYIEHISFISIKQIGSQYNGGWDIINSGWAQFHRGANTYWPAEPRNLFLKQIAFVLQCFWAKTNWPAEPRNLFLKTNCNCFAMFFSKHILARRTHESQVEGPILDLVLKFF